MAIQYTTVEEKKPKHGEWYLVKCPDYSESGFMPAKWNAADKEWEDDAGAGINEYVTEYSTKPLDEL